ncbi:alpha/beta hydrolase [Pseudoduganella sp. GCM10020061]|uniref:alpha/beta hydrolase n=1 Tax=Pseudoduganella sp. GCM10020061 TaxID=3317345 RepID=UPI0036274186
MTIKLLLLALACVSASAIAASSAAPSGFALENTAVRDVRAPSLKREYQVFVALPDSYRASGQRYPVLFVVDANYAFPVVRNIAQRLHKHAGMEEVIVVGLSYAKGDTGNYSRRRDYTPTVPRSFDYRSDMPQRRPAFGEAAAYAKFVSSEVFPLIAREYRADMQRKVFIGHSYGSLLGLDVLLNEPRTFQHYILGSPSLWFDAGVMFDREKGYAAKHRDLPASLYFGIGGLERLPKGKTRSRTEEDADMVADLRDFDSALRSHRYPSLTTRVRVFDGEDHASVFPFVLTHGLRAYLKSSR